MLPGTSANQILDLDRVVSPLPAHRSNSSDPRGLSRNWIVAFWLSKVIVKAQPHANARAGGATVTGKSLRIEIPLVGFAPKKLNCPCAIMLRSRKQNVF